MLGWPLWPSKLVLFCWIGSLPCPCSVAKQGPIVEAQADDWSIGWHEVPGGGGGFEWTCFWVHVEMCLGYFGDGFGVLVR